MSDDPAAQPEFPQRASFVDDPSPQRPDKPTGFGQVARQISSRTTDLLAIAIVLAGGLSMGSRLIGWWTIDPDEILAATASEAVWGNPWANWQNGSSPVSLEFGDSPVTLQRKVVSGDRGFATQELIAACRSHVQSASRPRQPISDAERELLTLVEALEPVVQEPDLWRIDQFDGPVKLIVGSRQFFRKSNAGAEKSAQVGIRRVVCWGLAFPSEPDAWTLYSLAVSETANSAKTRKDKGAPDKLPRVPLPPRLRRILSLRADSGTELVAFQGEGTSGALSQFFDDWFGKQGWTTVRPWESSDSVWTTRFASHDNSPSAHVDIQFRLDPQGHISGIISTSIRPH